MKKNFTLLFSLIALVSAGQTGAMESSRLSSIRLNRSPLVGLNTAAPRSSTPAPVVLAQGLGSNITNAPFLQVAATHLSTNASADLSNAYDTINTGENQIAFTNVADIIAKGQNVTTNNQGVLTDIAESGSNGGTIDVTNTKISNIGSYLSSGIDNKPNLILDAAGNIGGALKIGEVYGMTGGTGLNEGVISNKRASVLTAPSLVTGITSPAKSMTKIEDSAYTSVVTGQTPVHIPGKITTVENLVPTSALNMAIADSSALTTAMNTGATNASASVRAASDNTSRINTIGNSGALKIGNALSHSSGGVLTSSVMGGDANFAQNKINLSNDNG